MSRRKYRNSFEDLFTRILTLIFGYIGIVYILQLFKQQNPRYSDLVIPTIPAWLWALAAFLIEGIIIYLLYLGYRQYKLSKAGIREIDAMSGEQFEKRLVSLFQQLGYHVEHFSETHRGNEYGIDLILEKDGQKTAVQAKRYGYKQKVDNTSVEKLVAAKALFNCDHALVVTNSKFTDNACYAAEKLGVELWNRNLLVEKILSTQKYTR